MVDSRVSPASVALSHAPKLLRREVLKLKAERDILKKAAAYFAKEST